MFDMIKRVSISEKGFTRTSFEILALKKGLVYISNNLIDWDDNMYWAV